MFCKVTHLKVKPQLSSYLHHLFLLVTFIVMTANVCQLAQAKENEAPATEKTEIMTLKGQFLGSSYKAKLISIQAGDRIVLIHYDNKTTGLEEVAMGANVVLHYQGEGDKKRDVAILPELVVLPAGVTEIQPPALLEIFTNPHKAHGYRLIAD